MVPTATCGSPSSNANKIAKITLGGTITEFTIPTADSQPTGITAGGDGNVWFTEANASRIGRITPSGTITEFVVPTAVTRPFGITLGPDGNLWFTESSGNRISKISPTSPNTVTQFPIPTADTVADRHRHRQ